MPTFYFVSADAAGVQRTSPKGYPTVEDALLGAGDLLGEGAQEIRIVDNEGNLILPHDQAMLRLKPSTPHVSKGPARRL